MSIDTFKHTIKDFYAQNGRTMPWRILDGDYSDPYAITVSEIMLQQTQVERVIPKFKAFMGRFPDVTSLATADFQEVISLWSGLGYNRRAKYLHDFAQQIDKLDAFPRTVEELVAYRGIGPNTAAAILVYAYNAPLIFIETNIRTVYIDAFFQNKEIISDSEILKKIEQTIDIDNPREFYWGLMDYGTYLKKRGKGSIKKSKHYKKQSIFTGSVRQLRGRVIRVLSENTSLTIIKLHSLIDDDRLAEVLVKLENEQMIKISNNTDKQTVSIA